jgi:cation diffusion facilitator family transporter
MLIIGYRHIEVEKKPRVLYCCITMTNHADEKMNPHQIRMTRIVSWVGMLINILLSVFKIVAGYFGRSQTILADGFHSLSDTVTDIAVIVGVNYWYAPPDETHPHGHRRIETIITQFIGIGLVVVAVGISYKAVVTLHQMHSGPPDMIALIAALVSIVSKEILYHWTVFVGKKIKSSAVVANAWHHRSDAFSSIPAALAVLVARLYPSWSFVDHVGAIIVSLFILQAAWKIVWPSLKELADTGASPEINSEIEKIVLSTEGVLSAHKVRTRKIGYGYQVDLHIQVEGNITVIEGHNISEDAKTRLIQKGPNIIDVIVHLEPQIQVTPTKKSASQR